MVVAVKVAAGLARFVKVRGAMKISIFKFVFLFGLLTYVGSSWVFGLLALPLVFQFLFFDNLRLVGAKRLAAAIYCAGFTFGLLILIYSYHADMAGSDVYDGQSLAYRAIVSLLVGLVFGALVATLVSLSMRYIKLKGADN